MGNSWYRWAACLTQARLHGKGRRKAVNSGILCVEGLEARTLLTANLPIAVNDSGYVVSEDATLNGTTVLANDTDADPGNVIDQAVLQTGPTHGSLTLNPDGTFVYTPNANFNGTDSFTYFARDTLHNETGTVAGTVTITVASVADVPIAQSASLTTNEDIALNGTLGGFDPDGNPVTFLAGNTTTTHGTVTIGSNGAFTYTPTANFNGTDFFTFKVNDGTSTSPEATVLITVTPVNDAPTANSATITVNEDSSLSGSLTGTDPESSNLTFSVGTVTPTHGTVMINPNGTFTYTPNANFTGTDLFTFKVNDGTANSAEASVLVSVTAVNDLPSANAYSFTTTSGTAFNGVLTGTDPEGSPLTYELGTTPAHGSVTINPNGTFTYTPTANFSGTDSFTFHVNDGSSNSSNATVSITVTATNGSPTANPLTFSTTGNSTFTGTLSGSDPEGSALTFALGASAAHGTVIVNPNGTFSYTPNANYTGTDSFTFHVSDGSTTSSNATVSISVTQSNGIPTANPSAFTTLANSTINGTLTGFDPEGSPLTFSLGSTAAHGAVQVNSNGTFSYVPNSNFTGTDSFTFRVSDGTANSANATVSVTVLSAANVPVANPTSVTVVEDIPFGGMLTGTGGNGQPLVFSNGALSAAHGTAIVTSNGIFVYIPDANFHGTDSFSFKVTDGTTTSTEATVSVTVTAVNDAPVANAASITTSPGVAFNGTLTGTDADGNSLTYAPGNIAPAHGTVVINANGTFTYTPTAGYTGQDSFSFVANDGTTSSAPAIITVSVTGTNHAPVVSNGSGTVNQNATFNGNLNTLGSDSDGETLTYAVITQPAHGTLTVAANGQFTYVPATNFSGVDSFTFRANDGHTTSNLGTFVLNVQPAGSHLTIDFPSTPAIVQRDSAKVQIDPAASVSSDDPNLDYSYARLSAFIPNISPSDAYNGRLTLSVRSQGSGSGQVRVKGSNIYYNGSSQPIAKLSGGSRGSTLVINFNSSASQAAVTAVIRQLSIQASRRASTGNRFVTVRLSADGRFAESTQTATIV